MDGQTTRRVTSVPGNRCAFTAVLTLAAATAFGIAATRPGVVEHSATTEVQHVALTVEEQPVTETPAAAEMMRLALRGVHFVPNHGQWSDDTVAYGFRTRGLDIAFCESSLTMHLRREKNETSRAHEEAVLDVRDERPLLSTGDSQWRPDGRGSPDNQVECQSHILQVTFPGSNSIQPTGASPRAARFNYFIGDDESKWASDVPSYGMIVYENLYEGIDLHVMGAPNARGVLKYEFHCAPGSDHTQIKVCYDGIDALRIDELTGDLLIETSFGTLRDDAPLVWQGDFSPSDPTENETSTLPARFETLDAHTYQIALLTTRDPERPLVIDPEVEWMYYLGGNDVDFGDGLAVDSAGNALVTGQTSSTDFAGQNNSFHGGFWDAFALKVSASGDLEWMTYLGGSAGDQGRGIAVDSADNALVTGLTSSTDFAGQNNSFHGGVGDAFALKVSPSGQLQWMTYLGGSAFDDGQDIAADSAGNALVAGDSQSTDFAGANNSFQGGPRDGFALKVSPSGQLEWMTYLGGGAADTGFGIAADSADSALVTGTTRSTDFAGQNNSFHGGVWDAFALKVAPSGQLEWMTYLGGSATDQGFGIAADSAGNALVTGDTQSTDFAGRNNSSHGFAEAFAVKVSPPGQLEWMTYLGGSFNDRADGIAVDSADNALVAGRTSSANFEGRDNSVHGGAWDAFALRVSPSGQVEWMTYLGGIGTDQGFGIAPDGAGNALVTGHTESTNFAGQNNSFHGGPQDAFIVKLDAGDPPPTAELTDFEIVFGTHISGGLAQLVEPDDSTLDARSQFGFSAQEPNIVQLRVGAEATVSPPSELAITVKSRLSNPGGTAIVRLRNWSTNQFEAIHAYPTGLEETTEVIDNIDATDRVRAKDGRIEVAHHQFVVATFSATGFEGFFDWVAIGVN